MQVGDLVTYKKTAVDNDSIGVIIEKNSLYGYVWVIQWTNGTKYSENEIHLEVLCK